MKKKTSISISSRLLKLIDSLPEKPRSRVIEEALILYFENRKIRERDRADVSILNNMHKIYNAEALDTLGYQSAD